MYSVPQKSPTNQANVTQMESADNFYCRESPLNEQNFRSILSMLEQRQEFQEQEYKIKVNSLEKRIRYLISISSQLTQQNTQLKLQYGDLVKEYEILRNKLQNQEENSSSKKSQYKLLEEERDKLKYEREKLVGLSNKYQERSKIRKKRVKELENNQQLLERALNDVEKENLILVQEKQNLLLQYQQQQNSELVAQQQEKLAQQIVRKSSIVDLTNKNSIQNTIRRFLNDYLTHLNYIYTETKKLINQISLQFDSNLDANNQNNYNKITTLFETLIRQYNEMLESQLKLQFSLNISLPPTKGSKRNSSNNLNGIVNKSDIVMTSKVIKLQNLNMLLSQFIDSFICYIFRMRTLNYQIIKSESFTQDPFTVFRKITYLIIATIRMKKKKKSDDYKLLVIQMPIEETMYQLLEIVSTQQQLIERLQE